MDSESKVTRETDKYEDVFNKSVEHDERGRLLLLLLFVSAALQSDHGWLL